MKEFINSIFCEKKEEKNIETKPISKVITIDDLETKNFKKEDWIKTNTGLDNTPSLGALTCLLHTSRKMQQIRDAINLPIIIISGYRSSEVNTKVGGSRTSRHMQGLACDFYVANKSIEDGADLIVETCKQKKITYDKILIERGCIHIQFQLKEDLNKNFVGFAERKNDKWVVKKV